MIRIEINISYPGITPAEEDRLCEVIRRMLQPAVASACCSMILDPGVEVEGRFINSQHLDIETKITVITEV